MQPKTAFIYRIEKNPKHGLYSSSAFTRICDDVPERQPMPDVDKILYKKWRELLKDNSYASFYFGFRNIKQLISWLLIDVKGTKILDELYNDDFYVARFKVEKPDLIEGDKQVVFLRHHYVKFKKLPCEKIKERILKVLKK